MFNNDVNHLKIVIQTQIISSNLEIIIFNELKWLEIENSTDKPWRLNIKKSTLAFIQLLLFSDVNMWIYWPEKWGIDWIPYIFLVDSFVITSSLQFSELIALTLKLLKSNS